MKKKFASVICIAVLSFGVVSNINAAVVDFNYYSSPSDNDYVNNFTTSAFATNEFVQVQTGGITGGALTPPISGDWNDSAIYKQPLFNSEGSNHEASISFLFDGASVNPIRYNTTAQLLFSPSSDWNHYGVAAIDGPNDNLGLRFYGLLWDTGYANLGLESGHWYKLNASMLNIGGTFSEIQASASLFDLGLDGLGGPNLVGTVSTTFGDAVFSTSNQINSELFSERYGGAILLDNYEVSAVPIPGAIWLLGSGLAGIIAVRRKKR